MQTKTEWGYRAVCVCVGVGVGGWLNVSAINASSVDVFFSL